MAQSTTIRNSGKAAERRFIRAVPKSCITDNPKKGNIIISIDGADSYIQIKSCSTKEGTVNQVRPIKNIPCVIWAPALGGWHILSSDQLIHFAATKERGHHTEISFECVQINLKTIPSLYFTVCSEKELAAAISNAVRRGRKRKDLRDAMNELMNDLQDIKKKFRGQIKALP